MAKTQDFTGIMKDMMTGFPFDALKVQDAFDAQAAFGQKMTKVALEAAEKSAEISTKWTKATIERASNVTQVKQDPTDAGKAMSDFAASQAELISENLAAFAEVAKKVQMDTVELVVAAGKDLGEEAAAAVNAANAEVVKATKAASKK